MLLVWGGIILLVVLLVRRLDLFGPREGGPASRQTALEVLQERYARGEMSIRFQSRPRFRVQSRPL